MTDQQLQLWDTLRDTTAEANFASAISFAQPLELPDATIVLYPRLFPIQQSDRLFAALLHQVPWQQELITVYGRQLPQPRLTSWYGDRGKTYTYSGLTLSPLEWSDPLLEIKSQVQQVVQQPFNSVLLNLYRNGSDSVSWHSDDEPELGINPTIASVSFGATRRFMLRHRLDRTLKAAIELPHGSLLLMSGKTQHYWVHQIPKTTKIVEPRVNLTFRQIQGDR